ncbi:hypothetical protein T11_8635, partial [Trichinella zimbabwensis]
RLLTFALCTFRPNRKCRIFANICRFYSYNPPPPMLYNPTHSFMHYVFTQILRYSHAVLDCASLKAEVWTCPDMSGLVDQSGSSVWNRGTGAAVSQPPVRSASFPFTLILPVWLSRYYYCYGVDPHKRKQPCIEPPYLQHTCTLGLQAVNLCTRNCAHYENSSCRRIANVLSLVTALGFTFSH